MRMCDLAGTQSRKVRKLIKWIARGDKDLALGRSRLYKGKNYNGRPVMGGEAAGWVDHHIDHYSAFHEEPSGKNVSLEMK